MPEPISIRTLPFPNWRSKREVKHIWESFEDVISERDPVQLVDAGANVGTFTHYLREHWASTEIHAFEPVKVTFDQLRTNVGDLEGVYLHEVGLYQENTIKEIGLYPVRRGHHNYGRMTVFHKDIEVTKVQMVHAGEYFKKYNIQPEVMKVDIEGCELLFLQAVKEQLDNLKVLHIEINPTFEDHKKIEPYIIDVLGMAVFDSRELTTTYHRNAD